MKILISVLFLVGMTFAVTQERFVIGSWVDPDPIYDEYSDFKEAHFNLITSTTKWKPWGFKARTDSVAEIIDDYFDGVIKFLIYEKDTDEQRLLHDKSQVYTRTAGLAVTAYMNTYGPISGYSYRDHMLGYRLIDEPSYDQITRNVEKLNVMQVSDNDKLVWINFHGCRTGSFNPNGVFREDYYRDYVQQTIDAGAKVLSFDHYPFVTNEYYSNNPQNLLRPLVYKNYEIIAELSKKGNVPFWSIPNLSRHRQYYYNRGGAKVTNIEYDGVADYPISDEMIKFSVSLGLVYGSKGLIYHCYRDPVVPYKVFPDAEYGKVYWYYDPANAVIRDDGTKNVAVYDLVRSINQKVKDISELLNTFSWQGTWHGRSTDGHNTASVNWSTDYVGPPVSGLKTIIGNSLFVQDFTSYSPEDLIMGEFINPDEQEYGYCLFMNKDIEDPKEYNIKLKANYKQEIFNHSTQRWDVWNGDLTLQPGDFRLVRLKKYNNDFIAF